MDDRSIWRDPFTWGILVCVFALVILFARGFAMARDGVDWDSIHTPEVSKWYGSLMQPDNPNVSCCGVADAYWADDFLVDGDKYIAVITDTRDDKPLGRPHIAPGTKVVVPNHKLKYDQGNPTGHGVIFVNTGLTVYCYVVPSGI